MRTVRTKVYKFNELSEPAKEKAIARFKDTNVDYDWWESNYEYFKELAATIGVDMDLKKTYFSLNNNSGDGVAFTAHIDIVKLIDGIEGEKWKPDFGIESKAFDFSPLTVDRRVLKLIKAGEFDLYVQVKTNDRPYYSKVVTDLECPKQYGEYDRKAHAYINNRIQDELDKFNDWVQETVNDLSSYFYKTLEKEYDYLTSKEAIIESIVSNEYEFKADGTLF